MKTHESENQHGERMVAALYGELSAEEQRAFEESLQEDEALRAEWEELRAARSFLRSADTEESVPRYVFLVPPEQAVKSSAARGGRISFWDRLRGSVRSPATVMAMATAAVVVLVLAGLRVDRTDGGLIVGFGTRDRLMTTHPQSPPAGVAGPGIPLEFDRSQSPTDPSGGSVLQTEAVSSQDGYMTRGEFASYANELMRRLMLQLEDQQRRTTGEMAYVAHGVWDALMQQQQRDRSRLNQQIEEVRMTMLGVDSWNSEYGINPTDLNDTPRVTPVNGSLTDSKEEGQP